MNKGRILLVEPDAALRESLAHVLRIDGHDVTEAASRAVALEAFRAAKPDAVVIAGTLPDGPVLDLLTQVKSADSNVGCVLLATYEELDVAAQAIQAGAEQFLTKPVQLTAFLLVVDRVLENQRNRRARLREEARRSRDHVDPFRGESRRVRELADRAERVADSNLPVLIHGETGTGKGVLAGWIHRRSARRDECFLDLNCAGLSPEFLESELFGHEKGSFTGAVASKPGLLEVADRGSLFLDEIGDVPLAVQPKLLKVLEEKKFRRLGDVRERRVDVRLIAASHENLGDLVERARFRKDLFFRINTVVLEIPPLRERLEDLPALAASLLDEVARELGRDPMTLAPGAIGRLQAYTWPGNVRELRNALERTALLARGTLIEADELGFEPAAASAAHPAEPPELSLVASEKKMICQALVAERGRVARAAESLGISRSSLYEKIRRYGIVVPRS